MPESAWKFGPYRRGMGKDSDDRRIKYAVLAIKRELASLGYTGMNLADSYFGNGMREALKEFQSGTGLRADGLAGQRTCNALWRPRIEAVGIPGGWLRAQEHWESNDDPGAEFVNSDGSADRGLVQLNSAQKPATEAEAFDPAYAIPFLAAFLRDGERRYRDCDDLNPWELAVGRWRTPVGADDWCHLPDTVPNKDGTWAERAAFYVSRVDTLGRAGWV